MKIELLESAAIARRLKLLIPKHDIISIAVAWGDLTGVAETLIVNKAKFGSVLVGVDFSATDPDLIDKLIDVPHAFVAKNRSGRFHPKIFYFQSGGKAEAIVGSANFTKGGLGKNLEASVHVKGEADEAFFDQVRAQLASYKHLHRPITKKLAASYHRQAEAAGKVLGRLILSCQTTRISGRASTLRLRQCPGSSSLNGSGETNTTASTSASIWCGRFRRCLCARAPSPTSLSPNGRLSPACLARPRPEPPNLTVSNGDGSAR